MDLCGPRSQGNESKRCGDRSFKKAGHGEGSINDGLSIPGRVFGGCNHMVVEMALNMLPNGGEKYAYILLFLQELFAARGMTFAFGDLMCKWKDWALGMISQIQARVQQNPGCVPELLRGFSYEELDKLIPVVGGVHVMLHSWSCQVQYLVPFSSIARVMSIVWGSI